VLCAAFVVLLYLITGGYAADTLKFGWFRTLYKNQNHTRLSSIFHWFRQPRGLHRLRRRWMGISLEKFFFEKRIGSFSDVQLSPEVFLGIC